MAVLSKLKDVTMEKGLEQIYQWAMPEAPLEACGLLIDRRPEDKPGLLWDIFWLTNCSDDPRMSYKVAAEDIGELVAVPEAFYERCIVWHTHPSGIVGPSRGDSDSLVEQVKYLVMTIPTKEVVRYERIRW